MDQLLPLLAAALAFGAVTGIAYVVGQSVTTQMRIERRLPPSARGMGSTTTDSPRLLQSFIARNFDVARFGIDDTVRGKMRTELLRAGYFSSDAVNYFIFFKLLVAVVVPAGTYLLIEYFAEAPWYLKLFFVAMSLVLAIIGPDIFIDRRQKRMVRRYRELFPDLLDLLLVCLDAGLSLEGALDRVSAEVVKEDRALGLNLLMMGAEMRAGRSTVDALDSLADRLMLDEAQSFALVLRQSLELGSDVGDTLRIYSDEMRDKRVLRAEENANKLPVKMSIPLGICIFPVILLVILFPVVIRLIGMFKLH
jgi:tight adherence protein C